MDGESCASRGCTWIECNPPFPLPCPHPLGNSGTNQHVPTPNLVSSRRARETAASLTEATTIAELEVHLGVRIRRTNYPSTRKRLVRLTGFCQSLFRL